MNLNPEQFAKAQEMMKNMKPEELQNMFSTIQQNPQLVNQAMNMMNGGMPGFQAPNPATSVPNPKPIESISTFELINSLNDMKTRGNDKFNKLLYQEASTEYLAGILDVESAKRSGDKLLSNAGFKAELDDMEIKLRNNYCTCKVVLEEYELIEMHASEVIKVDLKQFKGQYHMALACYHKGDYLKAREHVNESLRLNPNKKSEDLKTEIEAKLAAKAPVTEPEPVTIETPEVDMKVEDKHVKSADEPEFEPVKEEVVEENNQKVDGFEIEEKKNYEKYFQKHHEAPVREELTTPTEHKHVHGPNCAHGHSDQTSHSHHNENSRPSQPAPQTNLSVQASFFEKNFQLLVGIVIGLFISFLLRK